MKARTDQRSYPILATAYQVMAPLLVASPKKMNVLYRGVEILIFDLSVPGVPANRVQASISTGLIVRGPSGWIASGMTGTSAEVYANVTGPDGSTRRMDQFCSGVKDLPPPTAYIGAGAALAMPA